MQTDTYDQDLSFQAEFYDLGQFAMHAVEHLCRVLLYYKQQAEYFLADPREGAVLPALHQALAETAEHGQAGYHFAGRFYICPLPSLAAGSAGAVAFECCDGSWTAENAELLDSIAAIYAYALRSEQERRSAIQQNLIWNHMMDHTHAYVYVTDPDTDIILYMNRSMKQAFELEAPEGKVCWQLIQRGQRSRCSFCPVKLLQTGELPACAWEEHNPANGRIYENYATLMRWNDGRMVHFQHMTDVTENHRLYKAAMTDDLTGALSRIAGKEMLGRLLEEYTAADEPISICMLDVNDLKLVNDQHGHAAGDALLAKISAVVRQELRGREFLVRLSGDEFVAVLPGVRQKEADERMQKALEAFTADKPAFFDDTAAFCYGVVEIRERTSMRDVLARADERMYSQKRALHIQRAEMLLHEKSDVSEQVLNNFTYDTERLYDALISSTDSYIYVCNMKTGVFRYPPAMVAEFGLPGEVIPNAAAVWGAKVHPHDKRIFLESNQEITDGRTDVHCVEYRAQNVRGEWVWLRCRGHLERDENGAPALFAGFITNLGKKNRIDPLTGLFNKFELEDDVQRALDAADPHPLIFMMLGIDGLKRINSLYDRVFGDEVIRITAQRLQSLLPANATVYRLDGDEFAIMIRDCHQEVASQLYYTIHEAFADQQVFDGKKFHCTLSCGCASAPEDGHSFGNLTRCATYALEYAKRRGKNRMEYYSDEIVADRRRMLELTELLRESVEQDFRGFQMHYQPIFDIDSRLVGAEALIRWQCDAYSAVGPDEFIPLLEQSGLILPVGRWIFEEVLTTCARWEKWLPDFRMSINLSFVQLEDEGFCDFLQNILHKTAVDPRNVILELTESYLAANMVQVMEQLDKIRKSGIRIAMDDFGTGYSSLGLLKTAPIDIAKIDRTFVKGIQSSPFDHAFLRLVVELCNVLGIETCLEGVETDEELKALYPMPLSYIQGFLLGRPVSTQEFEERFIASLASF